MKNHTKNNSIYYPIIALSILGLAAILPTQVQAQSDCNCQTQESYFNLKINTTSFAGVVEVTEVNQIQGYYSSTDTDEVTVSVKEAFVDTLDTSDITFLQKGINAGEQELNECISVCKDSLGRSLGYKRKLEVGNQYLVLLDKPVLSDDINLEVSIPLDSNLNLSESFLGVQSGSSYQEVKDLILGQKQDLESRIGKYQQDDKKDWTQIVMIGGVLAIAISGAGVFAYKKYYLPKSKNV